MSPQPHRKIVGQRPISAKSLPPEQNAKHRANGGKVAHLRKEQEQTPDERWKAALPGVLRRFRADMKARYAGEEVAVMTDWHVGRSWSGHPLEDECPCPKAPCGLVIQGQALPTCDQHDPAKAKTMRQGHPSQDCYADEEGA